MLVASHGRLLLTAVAMDISHPATLLLLCCCSQARRQPSSFSRFFFPSSTSLLKKPMIFRYFFPQSGGGWMRRYWQYRQQIARAQAFAPDGRPLPPLTLFDFARPIDRADAKTISTSKDQDGWIISDDRVIGGYSTSTAALVRTKDGWEKHLADADDRDKGKEEDTGTQEESSSDDIETDDCSPNFTPYLRWSGRLDTTLPLTTRAQRSGFCAIRSPEFAFDGADLRDYYNALEIQCREQGEPRSYTVNLAVATVMLDDVYQGTLVFDPELSSSSSSHKNTENPDDKESCPFETFALPFDSFRGTARGRERELSRTLDGGIKIEHIGFALMDGVDGDFQLDVARVRAVNLLDDGTVYDEKLDEDERTPP